MPTISDYLQQSINGVLSISIGLWVQLVNNATSTAYVSTAATDATGKFTVNNVPAGTYTVNTGPTNVGPWTATGDTNYMVDVVDSTGLATIPGDLSFTTAATRIRPGATSLSLRNSANSADNLLILDAGTATFRGEVAGVDFKPSGLTGAVATTRYVGATAYGKPTTGTFAVGDFVISQASGSVFVCTVAGTPGTWVVAGGMVNVLDYGAKGDGATDDTTAFNNAIVAAGTTGAVLGPTPPTNYKITGTITNASAVPLIMLGQALFSGAGAPTANVIRLGIVSALYVSSTGSDSNPGTSALPFLTLQKAVNVAAAFAGVGVGITIFVASGSYAGFAYSANGLSSNASGITAPPAGIIISGGNGGGTTTITASGLADITASGYGASIVLQGTITFTSTGYALFTDMGGMITLNSTGITFGACTTGHIHADRNSNILIGAGYTISGSAPFHLHTTLRGFIGFNEVNMTVTLTGSPVFAQGFASIAAHGSCYIPSANITFSGAAGATTPRFVIKDNATLLTNSGTATYLPGTAAGQCVSGGRYQPMPAPVLSGLTGCGASATIGLRGGSNDFEGVVEITNAGAGSTASCSFVITPGTAAPNQMGAVFTLGSGTAAWSARAVVTISGTLTLQAVTVTVDNNAVNIPAGTLEIYYRLMAA